MIGDVLSYLRDLTLPRFVLWCYLVWWWGVVIPYFDPNPRLWLSSVGIYGRLACASDWLYSSALAALLARRALKA